MESPLTPPCCSALFSQHCLQSTLPLMCSCQLCLLLLLPIPYLLAFPWTSTPLGSVLPPPCSVAGVGSQATLHATVPGAGGLVPVTSRTGGVPAAAACCKGCCRCTFARYGCIGVPFRGSGECCCSPLRGRRGFLVERWMSCMPLPLSANQFACLSVESANTSTPADDSMTKPETESTLFVHTRYPPSQRLGWGAFSSLHVSSPSPRLGAPPPLSICCGRCAVPQLLAPKCRGRDNRHATDMQRLGPARQRSHGIVYRCNVHGATSSHHLPPHPPHSCV